MMKRLTFFFVATLLTLLPALAQTSNFQYAFPYYAAIFTNVQTVEFFTGTTGTAGTLSDNASYYEASVAGLTSCIEANASSLPNSYTINGTGGTAPSISCNFYPNNVTNNSSFTVTGYTSLSPSATSDADATDGELLIITNSSTFTVNIGAVSAAEPAGMTLNIFAGYQASDTLVYGNSASGITAATPYTLSTFSLDENSAFSTEYSFAKIIPLVFYATVDVFSANYIDPNSPTTISVTWNASAP